MGCGSSSTETSPQRSRRTLQNLPLFRLQSMIPVLREPHWSSRLYTAANQRRPRPILHSQCPRSCLGRSSPQKHSKRKRLSALAVHSAEVLTESLESPDLTPFEVCIRGAAQMEETGQVSPLESPHMRCYSSHLTPYAWTL